MENSKNYEFKIDEAKRSISIKRTYSAKLDQVWKAFTDAKITDQWWAPKPWRCETKSQEFKSGGQWLYAMLGPDGEKMWATSTYQQIVPKVSFIVDDAFTDENGHVDPSFPQSVWETTFTALDNQTLVENKITYQRLEDLQATLDMGFKEGYEMGQQNLIDWLKQHPE
ncbi:SRPBCC domain-containing protein [Sphingobacterium sp. DK4209]|uniref:SRPBCC domain-containing protein n=1 Tax=Sphingobacterium zhuxiongii TaxID=2662364 RepID=A0A5Q0QEB6_9SPHI|nr:MULTISPECIES: SRPBCC domain-containing protein [unclassified Sphingobacterium]MVZ65151.1 SRPBCC domain-containing protein [Sphingobacterium sp. DK4209]QGA26098.1 SRPBCC domain-containing protein [Sphingobacterium sp. dk4302]